MIHWVLGLEFLHKCHTEIEHKHLIVLQQKNQTIAAPYRLTNLPSVFIVNGSGEHPTEVHDAVGVRPGELETPA